MTTYLFDRYAWPHCSQLAARCGRKVGRRIVFFGAANFSQFGQDAFGPDQILPEWNLLPSTSLILSST